MQCSCNMLIYDKLLNLFIVQTQILELNQIIMDCKKIDFIRIFKKSLSSGGRYGIYGLFLRFGER